MALDDTITSSVSHYCFRVIVFPRISSRSAHCIIRPSYHGEKHCAEMFPIQTCFVHTLNHLNEAYFTEAFVSGQFVTVLIFMHLTCVTVVVQCSAFMWLVPAVLLWSIALSKTSLNKCRYKK